MNKHINTVPEGYKLDPQGRMTPISMIKPADLLRDELVHRLVDQAQQVREVLAVFKNDAFSEIAAFVSLSASEYGARLGGEKGNVTLTSYDGRYRIVRAISEAIQFDERLIAAKALIDECLIDWTQDARDEIKTIINDAFRTDREGNINTNRVLGLRRLNISDSRWQRAMAAIGDAVQVTGSKAYIRIYERVGLTDKYEPIALDVAGV